MAKRRYNAKKIANTPALKKRMAKFCAHVEMTHCRPNYEEMLFKGHRGFVSYSEDDLAKEFDKRLQIVRDKYSELKAVQDGLKEGEYRSMSFTNTYAEITLWYEEGVNIANEIFEDRFLT